MIRRFNLIIVNRIALVNSIQTQILRSLIAGLVPAPLRILLRVVTVRLLLQSKVVAIGLATEPSLIRRRLWQILLARQVYVLHLV